MHMIEDYGNRNDAIHVGRVEERRKTCERCGHSWKSHHANPSRCPSCGTYHWRNPATRNECVRCGHEWFSRTSKTPSRCPVCRSRTWNRNPDIVTGTAIGKTDLLQMYLSGKGCVEISISTGSPLSTVHGIVRAYLGPGTDVRM